jgi:preprotein translocase subunit YajC
MAFAPPPSAPGTQADPKTQLLGPLGMFAIMGLMMYFVLFRPQQKKAKEHAELLKTVRPGDEILTNSGIVGVVVTVKEKTISIRSAESKLEITKSAIAQVTARKGDAAGA